MSRKCPECKEMGRAHLSTCSFAPNREEREKFIKDNAVSIVDQLEDKIRKQAESLKELNRRMKLSVEKKEKDEFGDIADIVSRKNKQKSMVAILRALKTSGFTPHTANIVKRYALSCIATKRQRQRWKKIKESFTKDIVPKLSEGDRLILGKFVSTMQKMSYDTGIRMGLTAFLFGVRVPDEVLNLMGAIDEEDSRD